MEIKQAKVVIKLDKEEKASIITTMALLEKMRTNVDCSECPFKERCDDISDSQCLLYLLIRDLKYVSDKCE